MLADPALLYQVRRALGLHFHKSLADFLGVSERTVQRHVKHGGVSSTAHYPKLIRALAPRDPVLAREFAEHLLLDYALIVGTRAPGSASAPLPAPSREHALLFLSEVADALELTPKAARAALATLFQKARSLKVDLTGLATLVEAELRPAKSAPRAP